MWSGDNALLGAYRTRVHRHQTGPMPTTLCGDFQVDEGVVVARTAQDVGAQVGVE